MPEAALTIAPAAPLSAANTTAAATATTTAATVGTALTTTPTTTAATTTAPAATTTTPTVGTTTATTTAATPTSPITPNLLEPVEDRRSLRTKRMLREAFAQLIKERGLDGFSVGELADRADINRGTFYAHYRDMTNLLNICEDEIILGLAALKPQIKAVTIRDLFLFTHQGTPPPVTIELFDLLREHGHLLRVLLSPDGDAAFQARLKDRLCADLVRSVLHSKYTKDPKPLTEYYIAYYAAAMLGLIQQWLERNMTESSEEMAHIMLTIMMLKPGDPIELKGAKS